MSILSDEELKRRVIAYEENGYNQTATSLALGIGRSTLQDSLARATSRGIGKAFLSSDPSPIGAAVAGTSTLIGGDGKPKLQWVKARVVSPEITIQAIKDAFAGMGHDPVSKPDSAVLDASSLVTVYPIADLHFGMYAWKEETGASYDTNIASKVLNTAFIELIGRSIPSDLGVVLNVGDWYHADNDENTTRKSGNKLDFDTRYARVIREGVKLMVQIIEQAKTLHKLVYVKSIPGNHDPYGALALTTAIDAYYNSDQRVIVDTKADPIWVRRFGKVLISAAHGDMARPVDMPGIVAGRFADDWGQSEWRYAYLGHIHQRKVWKPDTIENGGMEVEVFRTVAPKDAWGTQKGFVARRSLVGITHDHLRGEVHRATVNIK